VAGANNSDVDGDFKSDVTLLSLLSANFLGITISLQIDDLLVLMNIFDTLTSPLFSSLEL
jgi:hypothetical protein